MLCKKEKYNKRFLITRTIIAILISVFMTLNMASFNVTVSAAETASPVPSEPESNPKPTDTPISTPAGTLPDIEIYIDVPEGYFSDRATVTFRLTTKDGSMPQIQSVKARAGKDDKYQDVTTVMRFEITEDCTVHVVATDTSGRTYERSRKISCFDKVKPTLNASVSEGILEITAKDEGSGVKSIIVNGYEYTDLKDGKLTIRLTQFDGGYEKFTIQATDIAGNKSDNYSVKNPYHKNKDSNTENDPATELPETVTPTELGDSTADVTGHVKTDKEGIIESFLDDEYSRPAYDDETDLIGREFYTITTHDGKSFYLLIDRTSGKEVVRFLTDITENDLLHVVKTGSQSLPRNSAAKDSSITIKEAAIPDKSRETGDDTEDGYSDTRTLTNEEKQKMEDEQKPTEAPKQQEESFIKKNMSYIIMIIAAVIFIAAGYYFKVVKKRREVDLDEVEESDDDTSEKDSEDDYLGSDDDKSDEA